MFPVFVPVSVAPQHVPGHHTPVPRPGQQHSHHAPELPGAPNLPLPWAPALEYARDAHLGNGSFAKIFKIVAKRTGEQFAMKVMQRRFYAARHMEPQLNSEVEAMRQCARAGHTDHIVKLLDIIEENGNVFLRMELCGTSLEALSLQHPHRLLAEHDMVRWASQLFCGLQDIHALGIVHRDIKPENLLLALDGKLKIVDFGWCTWADHLRRSPGDLAGTFQFMAPEILEQAQQTEVVDVWSAGASLLELLTGQPLITVLGSATGLSASDPHAAAKVRTARVLSEIRQKCPLSPHARPPHLSTSCWAFCQALLVPQAHARISVPAALRHQWLQRSASRAPQCVQQPHAMPSWAPVIVEHPSSWDRSTSASSSRSTPRLPVRPQCQMPVQVLNWGDVSAMNAVWPGAHQHPMVPAGLAGLASPMQQHRL